MTLLSLCLTTKETILTSYKPDKQYIT